MEKTWIDKDGDIFFIDDDYMRAYNPFHITPKTAIEIADHLKEWAKSQFIIGKHYLTRDWKVVKYDGTQDVVARARRNKPGRFNPGDEILWAKYSACYTLCFKAGSLFDNGLSRYVLVSDLPEDMKAKTF